MTKHVFKGTFQESRLQRMGSKFWINRVKEDSRKLTNNINIEIQLSKTKPKLKSEPDGGKGRPKKS